jgi:putative membrane protein
MDQLIKRWIYTLLFGLWTIVLFYLLLTRRYTTFLRPEFGFLLALALFIAIGFMFSTIIKDRALHVDFSSALRTVVLLLPILFLFIADPMLGSLAFKMRFVGNSPINLTTLESSPTEEANTIDITPTEPKKTSAQQPPPEEKTILDLFNKPEKYQGKRVIFKGMIMRDEQLKKYFGGRDTAVYRFLITCCAADALPLSISVEADDAKGFTTDQWVQVDGIFHILQVNENPVPLVKPAVIKPIKAPKMPYMF